MNYLIKNKILIFNIFVLFLLFIILVNYMRYDILTYADRWETFKAPLDYLLSGGYPGRIVNLFFYKLIPHYFPYINPNDLQPTIISFTKSLIVILILVFYTKVFYLFSDNKSVLYNKSFSIVSIIIFLLIFNSYNIFYFTIMQISDSTSFMDWSLPVLFFSMLFYYIARVFVKKEKLARIEYFYLTVICILCGFSNVMFSILSLFFIGSISFFQLFINKIKIINDFLLSLKKYRQFNFELFSVNPKLSVFAPLRNIENVFVFFLITGISTFVFFFTTTYKIFDNIKDIYYFDYKFSFSSVLMNLNDFINKFIDTYICHFSYIYILLLFSILHVFLMKKDYFINILTYIGILFFSLISFFFIILLTGNSQQSDFVLDNQMFIYSNIEVVILLLCFTVGYIYRYIEFRKININEKIVICLIFIDFCIAFINNHLINTYYSYKDHVTYAKNLRIISFVSDKLAIESSKLDGVLLLPINYYIYFGSDLFETRIDYPRDREPIKFEHKIGLEEIQNEKSRLYTLNNFDSHFQSNDNYYFIYLKNIYNADIETLQFKTIAYIKDELEKKNINIQYGFKDKEYVWFSKLYGLKNKTINYNKIVQDNPNSAFAYISRGRDNKNNGDFIYALSDYSKAIELEPENVSYHFIRGLLYKHLKDFSNAIKDFEFVVNHNQKGLFSQYLLIQTFDLSGNYIAAIDRCGKLIKINPYGYSKKQMDIYYERANLKEKVNDFNGAIHDYKKSAKMSNYHFDSKLYKETEMGIDEIDDLEDEIEYLLNIL